MKAAPKVDSRLGLNSFETKRIKMLLLPTPGKKKYLKNELNEKGIGFSGVPESPRRTTLTSFDFCIGGCFC